jgi:exodeoxyribonuclease VII small subunit
MARSDTPAAGGADSNGPEPGSEESPPASFEAALERLETVVDRLESGDLELEAALTSFEEGVRLTRQCAEQLDAAERRIEVLMKEGDAWVARPFDAADEAANDEAEELD